MSLMSELKNTLSASKESLLDFASSATLLKEHPIKFEHTSLVTQLAKERTEAQNRISEMIKTTNVETTGRFCPAE